jgi:hypothetical protein
MLRNSTSGVDLRKKPYAFFGSLDRDSGHSSCP